MDGTLSVLRVPADSSDDAVEKSSGQLEGRGLRRGRDVGCIWSTPSLVGDIIHRQGGAMRLPYKCFLSARSERARLVNV